MIPPFGRGFSTFHALVAAAISFYLVMVSDLFNEDVNNGIIIDRKSWLSDAMFGVSCAFNFISLCPQTFDLLNCYKKYLKNCFISLVCSASFLHDPLAYR